MKLKLTYNCIRSFFYFLGTPNWYKGIDKPNLWQYLYAWRISPSTALELVKIIWLTPPQGDDKEG